MTGRQRLLCALNHREPDMVPIAECLYSQPLFKEVLGYTPEIFDVETVFKCCEKIGYDFAFVPFLGVSGFRPEHISGEIYQDEWGITYKWDPNAWPIDGAIGAPLSDREDWKNYVMPNASEDWRYVGLKNVVKMSRENGMGVIGNARGPFSNAWMLFSMQEFAILFYEDPELVESVLTAQTDFAIASFYKMAQVGADALLVSDDYGSTTAPLLSPNHFREFIKPQIIRLVQAAKDVGLPLILHSDGHVFPFMDDCVDAGISGWHPIERTAGMDLAKTKHAYGDKLCLFGNVDNKFQLAQGTPESIEAQVKECIGIAAPGGGYCLMSDHSVNASIPNRNVFALYEAGRKYGRYPIVGGMCPD